MTISPSTLHMLDQLTDPIPPALAKAKTTIALMVMTMDRALEETDKLGKPSEHIKAMIDVMLDDLADIEQALSQISDSYRPAAP